MRRRLPVAALAALAACLLVQADERKTLIPESRPNAAPKKYTIRDSFVVKDVPRNTKKVRAWFELPQEEALQRVTDLQIAAPDGYRIETEPVQGNRFLYVEIADPKDASFKVDVTFTLERWQSEPPMGDARPLSDDERALLKAQLDEFPNGETTAEIAEAAKKATAGVTDKIAQARKFYDFIIDRATYWKDDPSKFAPSGMGSATYCMEQCTGNCSDYHALYQAMARTVELPTQFVMGTALKADLDGVEVFDEKKKEPSYHCWVRTYFPGRGWVYSDISYADVFKDKKEFYFDHIDDWRVTFSFGRDLDLAPKQDGPKINFFVKCHVEADGKEHKAWTRDLTYKSVK